MGNACCGAESGVEKPVQQTDGELAGKAKFLSTPSFCEFSDVNNILGGVLSAPAGNAGIGSVASGATSTSAGGTSTTAGGGSGCGMSSGKNPDIHRQSILHRDDSDTAGKAAVTNNNATNIANAAKWFLCVFAPLNGQGLSFTAYHSKSNTLLSKYLTDAEIVKEKELQNISITYNMFFKALSTEVARAGRVGAKVSYVDSDTIALDCKIMIAGATSRRPDNFHVDLRRVVDPSPEKLYSFVIEPVCTQYYKRRANEGWNVERVDVSREKIYGEYETNFILRSNRLERNLDMLRELVPRVLQLRRDRHTLRMKRDALLTKLCVARTLLASNTPNPERLLGALPSVATPRKAAAPLVSTNRSSPTHAGNNAAKLSGFDALYPTMTDVDSYLRLPRGIFLSSNMPNKHAPIPERIPAMGVRASGGMDEATADEFLMGGGASSTSGTPKPRANSFISQKAIDLCLKLGEVLDRDMRAFEKKHPPLPGRNSYAVSLPSSTNTRHGSVMFGDSSGSIYGIVPRGSIDIAAASGKAASLPSIPHVSGGADGAAIGKGPSDVLNDSLCTAGNFSSASYDGQSMVMPSEDYFIYDYSHFPDDIQKRFATLPGGEHERDAIFRCWRSFFSITRFDGLMIESMSGGHALSIVLSMALGHHRVVQDLELSAEAVHDLVSRIEAVHARNDPFFNAARAADRVQFLSLFLKVIQSGEVPRLSGLPAIEKLCVIVAAAGCRADLHPPQEPFSHPSATLTALHIDSVNERHSLAVVIDAMRQHPDIAKFVTPGVHTLMSDFFLAIDPSRHGSILTAFLSKVRTASNFSRSLAERRLMLSVLLIGADAAFFARAPHTKEQWVRRLDTVGSAGRFAPMRLKSFSASARSGSGDNNADTGAGGSSPIDATLQELRSPLKINLPSTFRIGAASGFGGAGASAAQDDVSASCLVLRTETIAGGVGKAVVSPGEAASLALPTCMQGITKKSQEFFDGVCVPVFSCLRTLAHESLDASRRAHAAGQSETARDATYAVFARIAQCAPY